MKFLKHPFLLFVIVIVFVTACKKDRVIEPTMVDYKPYFSVNIGQYRIYDVDSIKFYDVTLTSDTFHYQIKEEVSTALSTEQVSSTEEKVWYEIKIYRRTNDTSIWEQTGFAMESVSSLTGERIKDNLHLINLNFPVTLEKTWKGNAYLTDSVGSMYDPDWNYSYTNVDTTFSHQGVVYPSCISVTQYDSENAITKDIERETYAPGIGLVYKNSTHVERQTVDLMTWIPEKGTIVEYRLREHN